MVDETSSARPRSERSPREKSQREDRRSLGVRDSSGVARSRESTPRVNAREPRDTPEGATSGEKGVRKRRRKRRRVAPKSRMGKLAVLLLALGAAIAIALVG